MLSNRFLIELTILVASIEFHVKVNYCIKYDNIKKSHYFSRNRIPFLFTSQDLYSLFGNSSPNAIYFLPLSGYAKKTSETELNYTFHSKRRIIRSLFHFISQLVKFEIKVFRITSFFSELEKNHFCLNCIFLKMFE